MPRVSEIRRSTQITVITIMIITVITITTKAAETTPPPPHAPPPPSPSDKTRHARAAGDQTNAVCRHQYHLLSSGRRSYVRSEASRHRPCGRYLSYAHIHGIISVLCPRSPYNICLGSIIIVQYLFYAHIRQRTCKRLGPVRVRRSKYSLL